MSLSALLHFNGDDDGTVFTEETGKTVSRVGTPVTSTDQKMFGAGASLFFNGSGGLTMPADADFDVGAGDFTIDFWVYRTDQTNVDANVYQVDSAFADGAYALWTQATDNKLGFAFSYNGTTWANAGDYSCTKAITLNTWHHVAIVRDGADLNIYVDGALDKTWDVGTNALRSSSIPVRLGHNAALTQKSKGYMDEFHFLKGEALYTAPFDVPTAEYDIAEAETVDISADIAGSSTMTTGIDGAGRLGLTIAGSSTVSFTALSEQMEAVISGTSTISSAITGTGRLASVVPGTSTITSAIKGPSYLDITIPGTSPIVFDIKANARPSAVITGSSTTYGSLALAGVTLMASTSTSTFIVTRILGSVLATFISQMLDYEEIDSGVTIRQGLRLMLAALAGKTTVTETTAGNGTVVIKDTTGTKNRITATLTNYSRTAMVLDKT